MQAFGTCGGLGFQHIRAKYRANVYGESELLCSGLCFVSDEYQTT